MSRYTQAFSTFAVVRIASGTGREPRTSNVGVVISAAGAPGLNSKFCATSTVASENIRIPRCTASATAAKIAYHFQYWRTFPVYGDGWLGAMPMRRGCALLSPSAFHNASGSTYSPSDQPCSLDIRSYDRR